MTFKRKSIKTILKRENTRKVDNIINRGQAQERHKAGTENMLKTQHAKDGQHAEYRQQQKDRTRYAEATCYRQHTKHKTS